MNKVRIVIIQRVFAKYRKIIYDELIKLFDLNILHSGNNSGILEASTNYSIRIRQFKYGKKETYTFLQVFTQLVKLKPDVIIHEFAIGIISLPLVLFFSNIFRIKFILWSHGYDRKIGFSPKNSFRDKYRLWLMKNADAVILYGKTDKLLLSKYVSSKKIFVAQNTLDTHSFLKLKNNLLKLGRNYIKDKYNFKNKYNLISIGRLYKEKKTDILISIFEKIENILPEQCALHIIGDGEQLELLKQISKSKNLKNIYFYGAIYDDIITGEMLFASDILIMPGPVGLSIVHAFCFDCPIITFQQFGHGPEIEYLIHGETGFIIDNFSQDKMVLTIINFLTSNYDRELITKKIQEKVYLDLDLNIMVNGISEALYSVLK